MGHAGDYDAGAGYDMATGLGTPNIGALVPALCPVPGAPTALTATRGNGSVSLSWTAPSSAGGSAITSYDILRATTPGGESSTPFASGVTGTTYDDTDVSNGTTYYYEVEAVNTTGRSVASNEASTTPGTVPGAPTVLGAAGNGEVSLGWTAPSTNGGSPVTSYDILRATTSGGESSTPFASGVTGTTYDDTNVSNGTTYYYEVEAVNSIGPSLPSNQVSATPATVPGAPTVLGAAGTGEVSLGWTAPSSNGGSPVTSYDILRATTSGGESSTPFAGGVTGTSFEDTSVANGTTYFYEVEAVNSVGRSVASNQVSATPGSEASAETTPTKKLPEVAVQGPGNSLWLYWQTADAQWHGPLGIGGPGSAYSTPSVAFGATGLPTITVQGPGNSLWLYWQTADAQWHGPLGIGGPGSAYSTPSVAFGATGLPTITVQGPGNSLWLYWQTADAQWHGPLGIGGPGSAYSTPSVAFGATGLPTITVQGPGNSLWLYWQTADAQWHGPLGIGGPGSAYSTPSVAFGATGLPTITVQGPGNSLWLYWQTADAQWHGPLGIGGPGSAYSTPSVAFGATGLPTITVQGPGNSLWLYWQTADAQWHGPLGIGGPGSAYSTPSVAFGATGLPTITVQGPGNSLWLYWQTADAQWHGPLGIGGPGSAYSTPSVAFGP